MDFRPSSSASLEEQFLAQLALIERIIAHTCRRYGCRAQEREDFAAEVRVKLIADNYAVLRKFSGQSSLATYLTTVIHRRFLDYRNRLWGKWRPSAEARRLGPLAERLECLVSRDGLPIEAACANLLASGVPREGQLGVEALAARLRLQPRRRLVRESEIGDLPSADSRPDRGVLEREREAARLRISEALEAALSQIEREDRLIVRLRMQDGAPVADIARLLGLEAKALYRRLERILRGLRKRLEQQGIDAEGVRAALAEPEAESSSLAWRLAP